MRRPLSVTCKSIIKQILDIAAESNMYTASDLCNLYDNLHYIFIDCENITVVKNISQVPQVTPDKDRVYYRISVRIKYNNKAQEIQIYTDPYSDYVYVVSPVNLEV